MKTIDIELLAKVFGSGAAEHKANITKYKACVTWARKQKDDNVKNMVESECARKLVNSNWDHFESAPQPPKGQESSDDN